MKPRQRNVFHAFLRAFAARDGHKDGTPPVRRPKTDIKKPAMRTLKVP